MQVRQRSYCKQKKGRRRGRLQCPSAKNLLNYLAWRILASDLVILLLSADLRCYDIMNPQASPPEPLFSPILPLVYRKSSIFSQPSWIPQSPESFFSLGNPSSNTSSGISILTWNVHFDERVNNIRYPTLLNLVTASNDSADVICLQEITPSCLGYISRHESVQAKYIAVGLKGDGIKADRTFHGCVILVKKEKFRVNEARIYTLPASRDGRHLILVNVIMKGAQKKDDGVWIGTAHIESPTRQAEAYEKSRKAQFEFIKHSVVDELARGSTPPSDFKFIVCGDTNLSVPGELDLPQTMGFKDAWLDLYPDKPAEPTFGILPPFVHHIPRRLDRIMYIGEKMKTVAVVNGGQKPFQVQLPGKEEMDVPLSDHLNVLASFEFL